MTRTGTFTILSSTTSFTFGVDFKIQDTQESVFSTQKIFRSNSVGFNNGRGLRYKDVLEAYELYSSTATLAEIEEDCNDRLVTFLDQSGTLSIDGSSVTGTWTLVEISTPEIYGRAGASKWLVERNYKFLLP